MIYLEYIERDRFVPIEVFRHLGDQSSSWVDADTDQMILQLGRTLRLGPDPTYLAFWRIAGLHRLDDWEAYFSSRDWYDNSRSLAMHRSVHIQRAGLYEEIIAAEELTDGLYVVEFFDCDSALDDDDLAAIYLERSERCEQGDLDLVLRRLGWFGPDPAHLAVWTFPGYEDLGEFLEDREQMDSRITVATAGVYRTLGKEIL